MASHTLRLPDRAALGWFFKRAGFVAFALCYLLLAARSVVNTNYEYGKPVLAILLALGPPALYLAIRMPAVFPLGAYVALIPFDALLRVSAGVTLTKLLGLATIAALALQMILKRRMLRPPRAFWAWLAWLAWTALTLLWAPDVPGGTLVFRQMIGLFVMMIIFAVYPFRRFEFNFMLGVIVVTGFLEGLYSIWARDSGLFYGSRLSVANASGVVIDQNYFAGSFILPAAVCLAILMHARSRSLRLLMPFALLPPLGAIFLSGSRSGFLSLLVLFLYLVWFSRHRLLAFAATAGMLALSTLTPIWDRFLHDPTFANGAGRTEIWKTALFSIKDHWLVGAGVGSFITVYNNNLLKTFQASFQMWSRPPHSLLVGVVTETGVVGLCLVLTAWYLSFRQGRVIGPNSEYYPIRLAFEAAILALFIEALFIDPVYIKYIWLANSLPLALANLAGSRHVVVSRGRIVSGSARAGPARAGSSAPATALRS